MQDNVFPGFRFDNSYSRLPASLFSRVAPTPVADPALVLWNRGLADELGLDSGAASLESFRVVAAGNCLPEGADPLAQAYAGHR